jgi:hypothetical protein
VRDVERSALETLRSGFLYLSAAAAVLIAAAELAPAASAHAPPPAGVAASLTLLSAAVAAFLYAVFRKIRPGMRRLSEADGRFRVCYAGATLILAGFAALALLTFAGLAILVSELATTAGCPSAGGAVTGVSVLFGALLVGSATAFAGYVLTFVVGGFMLYGKYRNPLYAAAATLLVSGALLASAEPLWLAAETAARLGGILTDAGYALTYAALDDTIKKLNARS